MKSLVLLIALLLATQLAFAASHSRAPMTEGQGRGDMGMMHRTCPMGLAQRVDGALAFIKAELKITATQSAAWDTFAKAYSDSNDERRAMKPGMTDGDRAAEPLPERVSAHLRMMEKHLAMMKKMLPAIEQLYAVLDKEQRGAADETIPTFLMCRMM